MLPCYQYFLVTFFLHLLLELSAEIVLMFEITLQSELADFSHSFLTDTLGPPKNHQHRVMFTGLFKLTNVSIANETESVLMPSVCYELFKLTVLILEPRRRTA